MLKRINPLLAVIITLIVIPALAYSIWQFSRISEIENEVIKVYKNQLKTVLFSLNNYSEDYISGVFSEIESAILRETDTRIIKEKVSKRNFISSIVISDAPDFNDAVLLAGIEQSIPSVQLKAELLKTPIKRLPMYLETGYTKKEAYVDSADAVVFFCFRSNRSKTVFAAISIKLPALYNTMYSPKMASEEYRDFLVVISSGNYEYFKNTPAKFPGNLEVKKEAVLFPGVVLSIRPVGNIFEQVIADRTKSNLILLFGLNCTFIIAVFVIYRTTLRQTELARQKSEFVANVSHELRTPLSLIRMFAETLSSNRITDEGKKQNYYRMIVTETERLTTLINSVLTFSKMESGKRQYRKAIFLLDDLLRETYASRASALNEKGFNHNLIIADGNYKVKGDKESLTEVIINLLDNAEKYSLTSKEITVSLHSSSSRIYIDIEDKGIGIPEKYLPKIFDKFYRVPTGDIHNVKGTGLGLSIVKQIVEFHGGSIKAFSREGSGSRFEITLPVCEETPIQ